MDTPDKQATRMGRNFYLRLRHNGVPETAARFVTKGVIADYQGHFGRKRLARAREIASIERADYLAKLLMGESA